MKAEAKSAKMNERLLKFRAYAPCFEAGLKDAREQKEPDGYVIRDRKANFETTIRVGNFEFS